MSKISSTGSIARHRDSHSRMLLARSAMKDPSSGVVSTPPKSEMTALTATVRSASPDRLVRAATRNAAEAKRHQDGVSVAGSRMVRLKLAVRRDPERGGIEIRPEPDPEAARHVGRVVLHRQERLRQWNLDP